MKKNLLLFGILGALLFVTYFIQEKRVDQQYEASLLKGKLQKEEITELKLSHAHAKLREGQWWQEDQLLSHNHFKQLTTKISDIKSIKTLGGDWKNFGDQFIDFEVNGIPWSLGEMSLDKKGFYVKKGSDIFLAVLDSGSDLVSDEEEIEVSKLRELQGLLLRPFEDLKEKQLFRHYPSLPMGKVAIKAEGNLAFELDLESNKTSPPPIQGISVHSDLKGKFFSLLTQVQLREELPYNEKLKFKKLGEISFVGKSDKVLWELWLKGPKNADAVIVDAKSRRAFLMVGGTLKVFFIQLQDYWDKKVIPPSDFKHFSRLPVRLIQGDKEVNLSVINKEPLDFEAEHHKVKAGNMQDLFQIIFNLGPHDQAQRVSLLSKSERQQVLSEEYLRVFVMGQDLVCWRKKEELIVVNLTQGFKAHFNLTAENFNARMEDVIE